jgi:cytochrome c-type biogenesis protein CcmH
MIMIAARLAAALGVYLAVQGPPAGAPPVSDSALEARTHEIAATLRCPACEDVSIEDSPADLARDMRRLVREQLAAGATPAQVRQYFVDRYGEWILLSPRPTGRTVALWAAPLLGVCVGGLALALALRRWTRTAPPGTDQTATSDRDTLAERREALMKAIEELERDRSEGKVTLSDFDVVTLRDRSELAAIEAALGPPPSATRSRTGRRVRERGPSPA